MKKVSVSELQAGMKFSKPVYVDGENLLVPKQVEIRKKDLDRLQKWGIDFVQTDGDPIIQAPVSNRTTETVLAVLDQKDEVPQLADYKSGAALIARLFGEIKFNREVDPKQFETVAAKMMTAVLETPDYMIACVLRNEYEGTATGTGAVNCLVLSVAMGAALRMDRKRLMTLATAAALHDVGMLRIPDAIVNKKTNLTDDELKRVRTHPLHSYQIITKLLRYPEEVALIALQHHERWDGTGYPRRLAGKNIAVEARIVAVADAFEAMIKEKPYRNSMIGYAAVRELLKDNSRRFDSAILKVFIQCIGIYPVGSFVLLNKGSIGRVVKVQRQAPLRPVIKLLVGQDGTRYRREDGPVVDLMNEKDSFILRAIDPNRLGARRNAQERPG